MGYYSDRDLEIQMLSANPEQTRRQQLETQLEYLKEELEELEDVRPHDPLDPLFDRYLYGDGIEDLNSCQGLLRAIRNIETELLQLQAEQEIAFRWWNAVLINGETPEGQQVMPQVAYPQFVAWVTAA